MRVAGMISGTSVDGIDVAIVDLADERIDPVAHGTVPYAECVREAILAVSNREAHVANIARLNFLLGELFAEAFEGVCGSAGVDPRSVELIGSHGQTIFHEGDSGDFCGRPVASTMQIGEASVISQRTGIRTVSDFRTADIAAGGKGAPLVPFLDYKLFRDAHRARIALNIGGIANITVIPANAAPDQVEAFDTGPGNMAMDALAAPFDRDGAKARAGTVNMELLTKLLADPYYHRPPPKSAGREQYGPEFLESGIDLATAAELTARTIAMAVGRYPETAELIVSGGGAHNGYLMERLRALIKPKVITSAELGVDIDSKEAMLFALLAYEFWHSRPANLPSATGARNAVVLGKLC